MVVKVLPPRLNSGPATEVRLYPATRKTKGTMMM